MVYSCLNCISEFHSEQIPPQICTTCNMRGMIQPKGNLQSQPVFGKNVDGITKLCTNCGEYVSHEVGSCPHCKFAFKTESRPTILRKSAHKPDRAQFSMPSGSGKRF